jgi:hypothetical protein
VVTIIIFTSWAIRLLSFQHDLKYLDVKMKRDGSVELPQLPCLGGSWLMTLSTVLDGWF